MKYFTAPLLIILCAYVSGCLPVYTVMPLKGKYPKAPYEVVVNKPYDEVWNNLIDVIAINGLKMEIIDKENGLVWTRKHSLDGSVTVEDRKGVIIGDNYWAVMGKSDFEKNLKNPKSHLLAETEGELNVRIRAVTETSTRIHVNFVNLRAVQKTGASVTRYPIKSTGVLEKYIVDQL